MYSRQTDTHRNCGGEVYLLSLQVILNQSSLPALLFLSYMADSKVSVDQNDHGQGEKY